jgi:hypothetical protein
LEVGYHDDGTLKNKKYDKKKCYMVLQKEKRKTSKAKQLK